MGKRITEERFNHIKELIEAGYSRDQIMKFEGISAVTFSRIKTRANYAAYMEWSKAHCGVKKQTNESPENGEQKEKYDDCSDKRKIILHYNSIIQHLVEIGRILNGI